MQARSCLAWCATIRPPAPRNWPCRSAPAKRQAFVARCRLQEVRLQRRCTLASGHPLTVCVWCMYVCMYVCGCGCARGRAEYREVLADESSDVKSFQKPPRRLTKSEDNNGWLITKHGPKYILRKRMRRSDKYRTKMRTWHMARGGLKQLAPYWSTLHATPSNRRQGDQAWVHPPVGLV